MVEYVLKELAEVVGGVISGDGNIRIKGVAGIHLMPIGWESITPTILERAGAFAADICGIRGATTVDTGLYTTRLEHWRAKESVERDEI